MVFQQKNVVEKPAISHTAVASFVLRIFCGLVAASPQQKNPTRHLFYGFRFAAISSE